MVDCFALKSNSKLNWWPLLAWADDMQIGQGTSGASSDALVVAAERQQVGKIQRIVVIGDADFLVLRCNPLENIRCTADIEYVVKNDICVARRFHDPNVAGVQTSTETLVAFRRRVGRVQARVARALGRVVTKRLNRLH